MKDPFNCSGYAQPRTYIEGQAWFTLDLPNVTDAVSTQSMHLHVGACVPHRQWVSGVIKVAFLVQRHAYNMPDATKVTLKAEVEQKNATSGLTTRMTTYGSIANANWTCDTATDLSRLCKQVYFMDVQTSTYDGMASQGLNTLRLVGITTINDGVGSRMMETRIESNVVLWNRQGVAMPYPTGLSKALPPAQLSTSGHPWAYTHAEFLDDLPLKPLLNNVTIRTSGFVQANTANVTGMFISVDPSFHQTPVNFGRVLKSLNVTQLPSAECPVAMLGSVAHLDCNKLSALVLDTRQLSDTKWHKLFIRTDSFVSNNDPIIFTRVPRVGGGTFSAVTLIPFRVNNTGNVIAAGEPAVSSSGPTVAPPPGFTPPPGVTVFNGSQPLPSTNATLNIAANSYNCDGWLEPRVYLEGGAWFTQPYQSIDYGNGSQLLVGACLPHGQKVAGKIPVDILLQKRNFPSDSGVNVKLVVQLDWGSGNITFRLGQSSQLTNWTCATPDNCRTVISIQADTKPANGQYVTPDGLQALTIEASTSFNWGASFHNMFSRVHSWVYLTNNKDADTTQPLNTSGSARLKYPWGNGNFFANLTKIYSLTSPVSGVIPVTFADVAPINITQTVLAVDPLFSAAGPSYGLLLASGSRFTNKTLCPKYSACQGAVSLDTMQLCNGVHRLVSRSDSFVASPPVLANYGAGTFSASNMATIKVQNPSEPASCAALKTMGAFGSLGTRSAARRAARAARAAPEMAVVAAQPRIVQELEVVAINDAALIEP